MGKILYISHLQKHLPETKVEHLQEPEYIGRVKHLDLIIWNHEKVVCTVVDFSCPLDSNITKKVSGKKNNYGSLIRNMQIMYPNYKFEMILVVVGCFGYVQNNPKMYMKQLGFADK